MDNAAGASRPPADAADPGPTVNTGGPCPAGRPLSASGPGRAAEPPTADAAGEADAADAGAGSAPWQTLVFPAGAILLIAGIPGAGKSTLIERLFGPSGPPGAAAPNIPNAPDAPNTPDAPGASNLPGAPDIPADGHPSRPGHGPVILDSAQVRAWLARRLGSWLPYPVYRPLVHTIHYARIAAWAVGPHRSVIVHECGTRDWARRTVALLARLRHRPAHLLFLDTPPATALAGQYARGRVVPARSFRRHERAWSRLRTAVRAQALLREGWTSARGLTRDEAAAIAEIRFE